jgi:hypothetical protein
MTRARDNVRGKNHGCEVEEEVVWVRSRMLDICGDGLAGMRRLGFRGNNEI